MITSVQNEMIKMLQKLKQKKYRQETNSFLVEGKHLVDEAIQYGMCLKVLTTNESDSFSVPTYLVSKEVMDSLTEVVVPQGVVALCQYKNTEILSDHVLLLDHLQDPGNLGTILRSAVSFGFKTIVLEECVDPFNPKVIRSTQGAIFKVNLVQKPIITFMKEHPEFEYIATVVSGGISLDELQTDSNHIGLLIGNEAKGLNHDLIHKTKHHVTIEMESTESLNASIAASICMYHLRSRKG